MAQTVVLNLFHRELDHMLNSPSGQVGVNLQRKGRIMVIAAKRQVGKDTKELEGSIHLIHTRVGQYQQLWIGSRSKHALIHHQGSRPHAIVPRHQQLLRFSKNGRMVYARSVMHPGTKANKYLSDQLKYAYV